MYGMAQRSSLTTTRRLNRPQSAFTLIELLTVVAIIALVMGLVVGAGKFARLKAIESKAKAGLEHLANALNEYYLKNGTYPKAAAGNRPPVDKLKDFLPQGSVTNDGTYFYDPWQRDNGYWYQDSGSTYTLYAKGRLATDSADDLYPGR